MYDEDTSDIDTDDLNADDLNADTNIIEDKTNYTAEEQHILNTAKRNKEGKLLAPNGKVSNLTEKQYAQVRTKAFKEWFGDWENNPSESSKVVDENGEPLVVYRGTRPNSTVYNTGIFRSKILFATPKKVGASRYGDPIALFMNARNPAIIDYKGEEYDRKIEDEFYTPGNSFTIIDRKAEVAINKGYDALIVKNVKDGTNYPIDDYVVLNPNQIKSATDNIGTFFRTDDNIYHADTNLLTDTEIYANPIVDGATDNAYGVRLVNDMDSFVRSFPEQYRDDIEHLMARDEIEYSCM